MFQKIIPQTKAEREALDRWEKADKAEAAAIAAKRPYGFKVSKKSLHDELQSLSPAGYVVLLNLRLYADEQGHCWPSMRRLSEDTGLCLRAIQANIKKLSKNGFIKIETKKGRGGKRFEYQILKRA
jgi:Helix-turn-helix domain